MAAEPHFAIGGPHGGGAPHGTPLRLGTRSRLGGGRPAEHRFTVGGSGKFVARCHRTVLAYWKFESISLQQTVRLSPDFTRVSGKAPVFRQFGGDAGPQGRERHRGARQPAKRSASVSVGRYSSTAVLPMRLATLAALAASEGRLATLWSFEFGSAYAKPSKVR